MNVLDIKAEIFRIFIYFVVKVKTLYPYAGHGLEVKKGEVMFLLDKTNSDWWNIRKSNGDNGYVPANYVKEVEPKIVSVEVKKPVTVKDVRKVRIEMKDIRRFKYLYFAGKTHPVYKTEGPSSWAKTRLVPKSISLITPRNISVKRFQQLFLSSLQPTHG